MQKIKISVQVYFIFLFSCLLHSQNTIKEVDYTANFIKNSVELQFENAVTLKAYDTKNGEEIVLISQRNQNTYLIKSVKPAQIIKLEYSLLYERTSIIKSSYLASPSMSSGAINVYFNHPVATSFAQTQIPLNLGNTLDDMLIDYINQCESTLDIAIYNSYSLSGTNGIAGAINAAYSRGVQVRVIYDGSTSSVMIPLLNTMIPKLASPTSQNYAIMHNKFVIFDANSTDANKPFVWTGSTNWTVAQIDGPDKNGAIVIQDQSLATGYKIEFDEMWGSNSNVSNSTNSKFGPYKTDNTPHSYLIGGKVVNSYFSPSDGTNSKIIAAINTANSDINIATMLITKSDISSALIAKFNNGLNNLNVVVDSQNPSGNQLSALQSGINTSRIVVFRNSGLMHHKFMCIDNFNSASDPQVLVGSHNWSNAAETKNDENILIVHDANITNQFYQAFVYIFQDAGGILSTNDAVFLNDNLVLYPNPTNGIFTITASNFLADVDFSVYDVLGNLVFEKHSINMLNEIIDLSCFGSGVYIVGVVSGGNKAWFKVLRE